MLAFCLAHPGFADQKTDSLYQIVNNSHNDSLRVIALLSVSQELKDDYPDSAMIMLDFAKKLNTGKYKNFLDALILNEKAMLFYKVAKYPEALQLFYQAKNLLETNEDGVADSIVAKNYLANLNSIGVIFFETGKFTEAIENFESVLDYYNKKVITIAALRKENFLFRSNLNLGAVYLQLREFNLINS